MFRGLPTPAAALFFASGSLFLQNFEDKHAHASAIYHGFGNDPY